MRRASAIILLTMVLVIATAGLVYELVMAAVASYVLGDSVTQFSIVIGVYLSALGLGAYLSRFVGKRLAATFVDVELAAALVGGMSAPGLFLAFAFTGAFHLVLYATVIAVGVLVGLELPLLIRILQREYELKELIARALTFDYAGALLGSLLFSLLLVPRLGLVHTSIACGLLNAVVGLISTYVLAGEGLEQAMRRGRIRGVVVLVILLVLLVQADRLTETTETTIFGGKVVAAEQSTYQRIVLAERRGTLQLYLNGNLQFSADDEHRYHEALVHPAMAAASRHQSVLIGGGGDGLAVREVLEWNGVRQVVLVDLDPNMTNLAKRHPVLSQLNAASLSDPRVSVVNADAMVWFAESQQKFDVVLLDFPDPSNYSLGKLYSDEFFHNAKRLLSEGGVMAVQSTSPMFARAAYWCVVHTIQSVGMSTLPYRVFVPSFGEWGFVLAAHHPLSAPRTLPPAPQRYLGPESLAGLFVFPRDMREVATRVNRLNNQALVNYYLDAWSRWD